VNLKGHAALRAWDREKGIIEYGKIVQHSFECVKKFGKNMSVTAL
jgi:hypothetical protein